MRTGSFVEGISLASLGYGAGMALWSFRACARGQAGCCIVVDSYRRIFDADGPGALGAVLDLARALGRDGRRTIGVAMPGCAGVTADELSLIAALAAAQARDEERRDAHLAWLFGCAPQVHAVVASDRVGYFYATRGLTIGAPQVEASPRRAATNTLVVHEGGRA